MSQTIYRCVIDSSGYFVDHVLMVTQKNGNMVPYAYTLKDGETLVDTKRPYEMIAPRWNGAGWEETDIRTVTITLADGTQLTGFRLNGSGYVSANKIDESVFIDNLSTLSITDDKTGQSTTYHNAVLTTQQQRDDGWHFHFRELTSRELRDIEIETQITDTQMAVVESYEYADEQNTNTQLAMTEVFEYMLSLEKRLVVLEGGNTNG